MRIICYVNFFAQLFVTPQNDSMTHFWLATHQLETTALVLVGRACTDVTLQVTKTGFAAAVKERKSAKLLLHSFRPSINKGNCRSGFAGLQRRQNPPLWCAAASSNRNIHVGH